MNKTSSYSLSQRLFNRAGGRYPIIVLLVMQMINTPLFILLTAMPAQSNAEFNKSQSTSLLIFGCATLLIRNALLLVQFYRTNKDLLLRLSTLNQPEGTNTNPGLEERAWKQANSFSKRYIFFEFGELFIFILLPISLFGYVSVDLSITQIIYLILAVLSAGLVNFIMGTLILDQLFMPVIQILLPKQFEIQRTGLKGMRLWTKLLFAIFALVFISMFLTIPTAYRQLIIIFSDPLGSSQLVAKALLTIINSAVGAIVVGVFISLRLIPYFSFPFRRMIKLIQEVEKGDLTQRIEVTSSDEFGELDIYLNHMIDRLHIMTTTLENQVAERTAQLRQANEQLLVDIEERKRMEAQLAYTGLHDPLTNLANRVLFMDRLNHAMERTKRHKKSSYAVFYLDLDRFKVVNDSLGHDVGDLLLIESARRLTESVRAEDTVARLGGDEFVILLEEMKSYPDYLRIAKRILKNLDRTTNLDGHSIILSISMGIVFSDTRYERPDEILRDADFAMYQAKKQGGGQFEIFDQAMLKSVMTQLELETELRKAFENKEFFVYYQPILDLGTLRIVGFEALLRWLHPTKGLIQPTEFIATAEEIGLIIPLGYWAINEACRQIRIWQEKYPSDPPLSVNINLSTKQCTAPDLLPKIAEILKKNKLDGRSLKLELTESLIVEDPEFILSILSKLREMGIQVEIDNFGIKYSSLGYLPTLPIDTLKIDRAFVSKLETNDSGLETVQTILALAHGLGMKVIAGGVETNDQLTKLKAMNCEYVQGFLISKAVDSRGAVELLEKSFSEIIS